jgi:hypothetical protein
MFLRKRWKKLVGIGPVPFTTAAVLKAKHIRRQFRIKRTADLHTILQSVKLAVTPSIYQKLANRLTFCFSFKCIL